MFEIDLSTVPPSCTLKEPDDCKSLSVVVRDASHAHLEPEVLRQLAGEHAADADWQQRFGAMLDYAQSKGWTGADGAVRAHIVRD